MSGRSLYTHDQLRQYFDRIGLPPDARLLSVAALSPDEQLQHLRRLCKSHIVRVPFENLILHYSWHRIINLAPAHLFDKIMSGRGGYCVENNSFFHHALLSLGFDCYMAGARIYDREAARFGGFAHCLVMINIGDRRYAMDVGFGGNGPIEPLELDEEPKEHLSPARVRFRHDVLPHSLKKGERVWIYEHRITESASWVPQYSFVDLEFFPEDISSISWSPSHSPRSLFTKKVICVRFTTDEEVIHDNSQQTLRRCDRSAIVEGNIDGSLILNGPRMKWRRNGNNVLEREFRNEADRLSVLDEWFDIQLSEQDKSSIKGCIAEIISNDPAAVYPGSLS